MNTAYFIGIDIGTQGARVVLLDNHGRVAGSREEGFPLSPQSREEQSPSEWWRSCHHSLKALLADVKDHIDLQQVKAIAVTSTSGTIIPLDKNNEPLYPAIMYSDSRSAGEALRCRQAAIDSGSRGYTAFNASSGLPKMLWFLQQHPHKAAQTGMFIHAADYITGRLSGHYSTTDYTNALKSGYDVHSFAWPSYIWEKLPLRKEWLQQVVAPGTPVYYLLPSLAAGLGLPLHTVITAGMTDGCASQVAAGAVKPGDWNTTIGTTLVVKGVTTREIEDPTGALYCHRHPEGYWMPGGASNTGADWVSKLFGTDIAALNTAAAALIPTGLLAWPLMQEGERFPFAAPAARGFMPEGLSGAALFAACMEGVAYIERYAYERIAQLSGETVQRVYTAGGGSNSDTWLTIRSHVLNLPVLKMQQVSGAAGAAILAASKTSFSSIIEAAQALTRPEKETMPQPALAKRYDEHYHQFIHALKEKGLLPAHQYA
jgi:sugar (pentulose or hexulose) kinase